MIHVRIQQNQHEDIVAFVMSGHAEAGPHGQDIVCAGASAVSIGAVNAIHALCDVDIVVDSAGEGGYLKCAVPSGLTTRIFEDVQLLLQGLKLSLEAMMETYPSFITVEIDRR
ncbi:ribosomal protein [Bacillus sp. JCM 19046]|uniref:Ribosomal processing cysteine protease Prp n=1 Tax=Shouchella xiaoxiensis TaxID=766895 RepID=A0ABS2SUV6_9BACI|nr:ribosomal-processing cysteine protease Prp [Shouchella xiaoxiensis]MBM7838590.1 uncharacterized protein YsxB (DUF464 family) [Shouchella xiaoxiensis]GAF13355.1 ribosomal protein [Bacillus sp. JCM 19045]GAF19700.1 ribosomal protein [Bacillus sp. JCM 19046]